MSCLSSKSSHEGKEKNDRVTNSDNRRIGYQERKDRGPNVDDRMIGYPEKRSGPDAEFS